MRCNSGFVTGVPLPIVDPVTAFESPAFLVHHRHQNNQRTEDKNNKITTNSKSTSSYSNSPRILLEACKMANTSALSSFGSSSIRTTMDWYKTVAILLLVILEVLLMPACAGPVNVRHRRMMREIYTDYENRPAQNETHPDGTCLLDGLSIPETSVYCEKKSGCRAIQKTGYCCPEYQCECEKDGKSYSNGEKLADQETPCKVCYCQGGEIVCSSVTCYKRDDCEPKYIPGRCCPEYDNCPPLEIEKSTTPKPVNGASTNDNFLQTSYEQNSAASIKQQQEMPLNNPLNITIKEITKVEEIRITDAPPVNAVPKPKPIMSTTPSPNPPKSAAAGATTPTITTTLTQIKEVQQSLNSIENKNLEDEISSTIAEPLSAENTKLTLVETKTILLPTADLSSEFVSSTVVTATTTTTTEDISKVDISDNNSLNGEESVKIVRHATSSSGEKNSNENNNGDGENESSNKSGEKGESSHEEEEVVIIDKNGESKPITVFGVKGLQRGDVIEDPSLSLGGNKLENVPEHKDKNQDNLKEHHDDADLDPIQASSSDDFVRIVISSTTEGIEHLDGENGTSESPESQEIYESVLYTSGPDSSISPSSPSSSEEIFDPQHYTPGPDDFSSDESNITSIEKIYEPIYHDLENDTISTKGPENVSSEPFPFEQDDEVDRNPAYPKIEEDLSIHREINGNADYLEGNTETKSLILTQAKEEPRSVIEMNDDPNTSESSSPVMIGELKLETSTEELPIEFNTTFGNDSFIGDMASPEPRVPGEPCLIPEWERINGTGESRCNQSYDSVSSEEYGLLTLLKGNESWSSDSMELDFGSGSGSGGGSGMGIDREPTTPRHPKIIDIDDIDGDSSSGNGTSLIIDPKEDAESLKLDDDDNSSSGTSPTGSGITDELNSKTAKTFVGLDSFIFN